MSVVLENKEIISQQRTYKKSANLIKKSAYF